MAWIHWGWTSYSCHWLATESRIWIQTRRYGCLLEWIVPNINSRGRKRCRRDQGKDLERWVVESRCSSVQHFEDEIVPYLLVIKWPHSNVNVKANYNQTSVIYRRPSSRNLMSTVKCNNTRLIFKIVHYRYVIITFINFIEEVFIA